MSASMLADLIGDAARASVIGLAKNTGKTRTLVALLAELHARVRSVGLTSVGRDGERDDILDPRIPKPPVAMPPGGLVATSEQLLRAAGVDYEVLDRTGYSTPLGHTVIARLPAGGAIEIAGPSSNAATAKVCDTMLELGADQVLIDGAINRRAAASPSVADVVVLATGAALHRSRDEVVAQTVAAVETMTLPVSGDPAFLDAADAAEGSVAVLGSGERVALERRVTLGGAAGDIDALFRGAGLNGVLLGGALCESFVDEIRRRTRGRKVSLVARDSSRVFLSNRSCSWYRGYGVSIEVLRPTVLAGLTVNPVAPLAHRFDSVVLRGELSAKLPGLFVCDLGPHVA